MNSVAAVGAALRGLATLVAWSSLLRTFPRSADHSVAGGLIYRVLLVIGAPHTLFPVGKSSGL